MSDPAAQATHSVRAATARAAGYVVRPVERADLGSVARVHVQVWREAYSSLLAAEHLAALDVGEVERRWGERLEQPTPGGVVHLTGVHPERGIVAVGTAGPSRDPDPAAGWELWALNVLASEHGSGLADLLMAGLVGRRACSLWVLRGNVRATAFYRRHGFVSDGCTKPHPATGSTEERMVRHHDHASPASADTPKCVSKAELRAVEKGWSMERVTNRF